MLLLVCILKDYRRIEDLVLGFLEIGITGATLLEGRGMGQLLSSEHPLFASVRGLFPGSAVDSHVLIAVTDAPRAQEAIGLVERVAGPLHQPGAGVVFTLPVGQAIGLAEEIA